MKNKLGLISMMAFAMMEGGTSYTDNDYKEPKETDEQRNLKIAKTKIKRYKANGLKEFFYGSNNSVWAINQKNADKKARINKWI